MGADSRPSRAGKGRRGGNPAPPAGKIANLLDIGTGTGRMLELLAPRAGARRRPGCQPGNAGDCPRQAADGSPHAQVRLGDLYRLPFANAGIGDNAAGFDAVLFHQVLHYLDDPGAAVLEAPG